MGEQFCLGPYELGPGGENEGIYTGDARVLSEAIPGESIDLTFTDPVYQNIDDYRWLAETAARVLKPGGSLLVYLAQYHMDKVLAAMTPSLIYRWLLVEKKISTGTLIWSYRLYSHYIPLLWLSKGPPSGKVSRIDFLWSTPDGPAVNHRWSKNKCRIEYWLNRFGESDTIVWEPFCGGGSIISACKAVSRQYLAFEIDPVTAELARGRVRKTQPPLPGLVLEMQAALKLTEEKLMEDDNG